MHEESAAQQMRTFTDRGLPQDMIDVRTAGRHHSVLELESLAEDYAAYQAHEADSSGDGP